mgnify:CR=1 FL=1
MGTFIGIAGDVSVPEERQRGYVAQIMTVLTHGGMLQSETIRLFGRFVTLIHFPEFDVDSGCLEFNYNYLENRCWERCALSRDGILSSGKVGSYQFRDVAQATCVLEEQESYTDALATLDDRLFCTDRYVGWLNWILGTNYPTRSLRDLAKIVHAFSEEELPDRCTELINVCNGRVNESPAEPVSTADFLRCMPDDLAFLWSPNGKIEFSAAMWEWLASLRHRLDALTAAEQEMIPPSDSLKTMVTILAEINPSDSLIGNFAWREMFFDWIQAASNLRVQASLVLMKELASQPSDATQCVSNLRRYLAVLGNPALREYALEIYIDR